MDPEWIRIRIQPKMLDPDLDEMNADPQPCFKDDTPWLRECQDIKGPASVCLVIIWSPLGGSFCLPVFLVCSAKCRRCGGLLQCQWYFIPVFPVRRSSFSLLGAVLGSVASVDPDGHFAF
jgi:hypothetical protein